MKYRYIFELQTVKAKIRLSKRVEKGKNRTVKRVINLSYIWKKSNRKNYEKILYFFREFPSSRRTFGDLFMV